MDPRTLIDEGYQLYIQNNSEGALKKYNEALKLALDLAGDFPEALSEALPEALYHRGLVYKQLRKEDEAKEDFSRSLRFLKDILQENPTYFNSKNYLGLVYLKLNELKKAEETFNEIIDKASKDSLECANAFKGIGNYYYESQNYKEALNAYKEALKIYRNYVKIDINKGVSETINKVSKNSLECANAFKGIGNCYYWLKNYEETLTAYEEALIIYPNYVDIHFNKGVVFATQGKYKKSIECYEKALKIAPTYYLAHNGKSYVLYETESYEEALQACNQCLEFCSDYCDALSIQSMILLRLGRYEEALRVLGKAVGLYPDFDEAWYNKGSVHYFLEQFDKAQEAFDKVITLKKDYVSEDWSYKGIIFAKNNDYENAMESFSKGKEDIINRYTNIDEKSQKYLVPLMLRKSFVFYLFGKYQEVLSELNSIDITKDITSNTNAIHILTLFKLKGIVYEKLSKSSEIKKNFEDSRSNLKKMLSILKTAESYKANVYCEKGIILRRCGEYKESIEAFKEALKENPAHFYSMNELGIAYRKIGEPYKALKSFKNAVQKNSNYYEAWINKALVLRCLLDYEGSERAFDKAMRILNNSVKLNKDYSVAYYHMGLIHYDREDYENAIYCFNKATKSKECYEDAELNKGLSLISLKKYDEAIDIFDQIIDTAINNNGIIIASLKKEKLVINNNGVIAASLKKEELKRYKLVLKSFNDAIIYTNINNNEVTAASLNNKGIALLCKRNNELARENFTEAAELDERNPDSQNNIGLVNYYEKKYKLALKSFKEAIDIGNTYKQPSGDAWNNKGILLFNMEKVEEAKEAFNTAISISPEYSSVRKNKGLILCKLGEHEEALKTFEEASRIRPKEGKIHTLIAGSLLKVGDIQRADEEIEKAFKDSKMSLHEKSNAYNIKGQIKIEKLDYDGAINSFEKAIYFNPSNLSLLVWNAYAKYLKVEFLISKDQNQNQNPSQDEKENSKKINPINKKYQEGIVSIIRDLEKISIEFNKKQKSISLPLFILLKIKTLMEALDKLDLFIYGEYESKEPKKIRRLIKNHKGNINLSIMEHEYEKITEERTIEAYIFYFTGYLYYKIDDLYSSLSRLKKCVNNKSGPNIEEPAKNLIQNIWEYKIRPPFWKWWLDSPINKWRKRTIFGFISISFLGMLFPSLTLSLVFFLTKLFTSSLPSLEYLVNNLNHFIYIFFSSVTGNTQYIILTILVFVLLFPSIQHIKSKDFEVDLNNSPVPFVDFCPLIPDFTPEKSTTLIKIKKRPRPLEIHEIRGQTSLDAK